jgi:hypothetical protein
MKLIRLVMFVGICLLLSAHLILGNSMAQNSPAAAGGQWVRWNDIIGIIAPGSVVGTGTTVTGWSQPWSTEGGSAEVNLTTGRVMFEVRGLALAEGIDIGTPGSITEVMGTLVCNTHGTNGTSVLVNTGLVSLSKEGNASFMGTVSIPSVCQAEPDIASLIQASCSSSSGYCWIANGAVRSP